VLYDGRAAPARGVAARPGRGRCARVRRITLLTDDNRGKISLRHLDSRTILWIAQKRARETGVKHLPPDDLRKTMRGDLLDAGVDLATMRKLVGHAQVTTTGRYRGRRYVVLSRYA
jgi:site-specific recombinase XerD